MPSGAQHGFLLTGKNHHQLRRARWKPSRWGISINNSGQYTSQTADSSGNEHSFINTAGTYTELLFPKRQLLPGPPDQRCPAWPPWAGSISAGNEEGGLYESASATYIHRQRPNSALTGVEGINDSDTLVGIFATPDRFGVREFYRDR